MEKALKQHPGNCIRVCLFGPESSGKSTLSRKLAQHYNAALVPEYARDYLQTLWDKEQQICRPKDLLPIAAGQMALENQAVAQGASLIICDTDLLTTKVYSEAYYNHWCPKLLETYALENRYDLYLLTYIDTPWEADDLRDKPDSREEMFTYFRQALARYRRPFVFVHGSIEQRLHTATKAINTLLV